LIDIAPSLINNDKTVRVVIGGSGPLEKELKEKTIQMKLTESVFFPGRIPWDEVPNFLAASDIFVLPSQRDLAGNLDGLPTVLLEAMACGLPCVASDVGGVGLVINNKNGFLIQPSNTDLLLSKLQELIRNNNLRQNMSAAARNAIVSDFNWENVAKQLDKIIRKKIFNPDLD
jgi:glycosyltransferase involved in cell wall biosynthesis